MLLQTQSLTPLFLPPLIPFKPVIKTQFIHFKKTPFRKLSLKCSVSTVSKPTTNVGSSNDKPFPAEVSRTIMELSSIGTLSMLTSEGWPLGVGVRFVVDDDGTPVLCLNGFDLEENLVTLKSKKQSVVARSSAEAEYRAMASTTYELIWLKALVRDLRFEIETPIKLLCNNKAAIYIATNLIFHERTKHIEMDCHFIREKIQSSIICTPYVLSGEQLADVFTKPPSRLQIRDIISKLQLKNIFQFSLRGSVEK